MLYFKPPCTKKVRIIVTTTTDWQKLNHYTQSQWSLHLTLI